MEIKIKHGSSQELHIAVGRSRQETKWKNTTTTWLDFLKRIGTTTRTYETVAEYKKMGKTEQDRIKDVGGYVGGTLREGRRKNGYVDARSLITLDADFATPDLWSDVELMAEFAIAAYSTHKHTSASPRLRFLIPLSRDVSPEEYEAIARWIANEWGMDYFDDTTYEPARLMYWPSTSKDGEFFFEVADNPILDPDTVLAKYKNWKDSSYWPESSRSTGIRKKTADKQGDPLTKPGLVGAFCRTYEIEEAIATFLPDAYIKCDTPGRYTYQGGSTAAGLVIYDGKFAYSNHATDPISGQLCNAFDLVRIHLFGELDLDAKPETPMNKLPSWTKMCEMVGTDENVRKTIGEERLKTAESDFSAPLPDSKENSTDWMKRLTVTKGGGFEPSLNNFYLILENDPNLQIIKGRDLFCDKNIVEGKAPWPRDNTCNMWTDVDDAGLRWYISNVYKLEAKEKIIDAVRMVFEKRSFHPVKEFIESTEWDEIPRVETLLIDYLGAKDTPYIRAITRKTLVAAVARVYDPGCKFDYMLTLVGDQGIGKTLLVQRLAGQWFSNSMPDIRGKESYEALDGVWIMEMGELAALKKSDRDTIKNYISKREDTYRKAYARNITINRRHTIFIGTTNESTFLEDDTGNRRYWVVDTDANKRSRTVWGENGLTDEEVHQIWAEAYEIYQKGENIMELSAEEKAAAEKEQESHTIDDPYQGQIDAYLKVKIPHGWVKKNTYERVQYYQRTKDFEGEAEGTEERTVVSSAEVWIECLGNSSTTNLTRADTKRIYRCLEKLGWKRLDKNQWRGGEYGAQKCYGKTD